LGRVEKLLDTMMRQDPALAPDVQLERLMVLRQEGKHTEADALERELLASCREEPANPARIDERLLESDRGAGRTQSFRNYAMNYLPGSGWQRSGNGLPTEQSTIAAVAEALGVSYTPDVTTEDMTPRRIREAYERHGLYEHAVRLIDAELAAHA